MIYVGRRHDHPPFVSIRRRRRVTRPLAAWHLLRHGSVIYGVHFLSEPHVGVTRQILVWNCIVDPVSDDGEEIELEKRRRESREYVYTHFDDDGCRIHAQQQEEDTCPPH